MRRSSLAWIALAIVTGCVEVPQSIKTDFAPPGANDRTNYRPGTHGAARPAEDATPKLATVDAGPAAEPTPLPAVAAEGGAQ